MTEEQELILDMFTQACLFGDGYDHMCISAYEQAQKYLIDHNIIDKSECHR